MEDFAGNQAREGSQPENWGFFLVFSQVSCLPTQRRQEDRVSGDL